MNSEPQLYDWLVLAAIFLGPLIGIWVTRFIDRTKDRERRREGVFEGLMKTRGLELSPDHVGSLNMVPLLFKEPPVRSAYSRLMEVLNDPALASTDQTIGDAAFVRLNNAKQDLLREIGHAVRMPLPANEHERLGYAPNAWQRQQAEQDQLRALVIEWLEGRRHAPVMAGVYDVDAPDGAGTENGE